MSLNIHILFSSKFIASGLIDSEGMSRVLFENGSSLFHNAGLSLRIFRHSYCGRVVQKSHSSTPKFTSPHLECTKYTKASEVKP